MDKTDKKAGIIIVVALSLIVLLTAIFGSNNNSNIVKSIIKNRKIENSIVKIDDNCKTFATNELGVVQNGADDFSSLKDARRNSDGDRTSFDDGVASVARQSARGGVVVEQTSRRVLLDEGAHTRCFPASTTKVLTALVVLERMPLDKIVEVPKEAENTEGSSLYLRAGQKISVEDLLFGLMLRSGNDAAVTLAIATAGSVEEFASIMNDTAKQCGALNSNFVNPHGLHDDNHYTTAYDLAMICARAYEYEDFARLVDCRQRKITVDGEAHYIANKNKLLAMYDGSNGVKTGFTKTSGRCLVGGAKRDGMQLISVVLNYNDMWNDTIRMLDFCFDKYEMISLDDALIKGINAGNEIEIFKSQNVNEDWSDIRYPIKKDGSERLVVKSA